MRWGTDQWGTFWGAGTQDTKTQSIKPLSETITSSDSIALTVAFNRTLTNTLDFTEDLSRQTVSDSSGYSVLYPGNSTNAENRVLTTYSTATAGTPTYSSSSAGSTTWS